MSTPDRIGWGFHIGFSMDMAAFVTVCFDFNPTTSSCIKIEVIDRR